MPFGYSKIFTSWLVIFSSSFFEVISSEYISFDVKFVKIGSELVGGKGGGGRADFAQAGGIFESESKINEAFARLKYLSSHNKNKSEDKDVVV